MIRLTPRRTHPVYDRFEVILQSNAQELIDLLRELQTAQTWGYAKGISMADVMIAIAELDKESQKLQSEYI